MSVFFMALDSERWDFSERWAHNLERSALGYVHQPPIFTFKFRTSKNQCSAASVLAARMAGVTARSSLETEKGSYRIAAD
jgi:hypothetical protein